MILIYAIICNARYYISNISDLIIVFKYYPQINPFFNIFDLFPEVQREINNLGSLADIINFVTMLSK